MSFLKHLNHINFEVFLKFSSYQSVGCTNVIKSLEVLKLRIDGAQWEERNESE